MTLFTRRGFILLLGLHIYLILPPHGENDCEEAEFEFFHVSSRFSTNEGETWTDFKFSDREVFVYQLLTEPGEKSTIFTIFGSYADQRHSWLILQVNTSDVLGKSGSQSLQIFMRTVSWFFSMILGEV